MHTPPFSSAVEDTNQWVTFKTTLLCPRILHGHKLVWEQVTLQPQNLPFATMHGTSNWKILKCRWNRLHSASWLCNGAQVENLSGVICVWRTACLHRTARAPKPLYCSCIGCLCGNGKCTEKWRGGDERTATYKYFSDINLYPNASVCQEK